MPSTIATTTVQASSKPDLPKQVSARFDGDQFLWSYTEEPHRTRRQAIIKAHPEVINFLSTAPFSLANLVPGNQALRARALDEILRTSCCCIAIDMCSTLKRCTNPFSTILPYSLHHRCNSEPKSLPSHS